MLIRLIVRNVHSKKALLPKVIGDYTAVINKPVLMVKSTPEIYGHVDMACYFLFSTFLSHQG